MANTYDWQYPQLDVQTSVNGKSDIVYIVHWVVEASDGAGHTAGGYGCTSIPYDENETFVPFDQLTKDMVDGWVKEALGADQVTNIQTSLDQKIADQISPPVQTLPPPWTNQ